MSSGTEFLFFGYSLSLSRSVTLKIRLITAGGEFGSFLLFGKKKRKKEGQACTPTLSQILKST